MAVAVPHQQSLTSESASEAQLSQPPPSRRKVRQQRQSNKKLPPKGPRIAEAKPSQLLNLQNSLSPSDDEYDEYSKKIKERNRVASKKFRVKKREDAKKLRVDEENMKQTNRKLSSSVSDLTQEVYELKMKLLQHTDCDCHMIRE